MLFIQVSGLKVCTWGFIRDRFLSNSASLSHWRDTYLQKLEVLCSTPTEMRVLAQNPCVFSLSSEYCLKALNFVPTASVLGLCTVPSLGVMLKGCHVYADYQIAPLGENKTIMNWNLRAAGFYFSCALKVCCSWAKEISNPESLPLSRPC